MRDPIAPGPLPGRLLGMVLCGLLAGIVSRPAGAQDLGPLRSEVSVFGAASSSDRLPFWLGANEFGTVDRDGANLGTRLSLARPFDAQARFDVAFGVDVVARASTHSTLHAHQLYGQLKVGPFQATAGKKRRTSGLVDSTLSMGSMMTSENAPPLPRVSVSTPDWVGVPGTQDYLSFKGYFAHGWFTGDRVIDDAFLHSKYVYLRVFPNRFPVQLHGGVVHGTIWAGTSPTSGDLPDDLEAYWKVLTAQSSPAPGGGEALGSGNGMYDYAITARAWGVDAQVYREFYIETAAGADHRNVWDGLWGVSLDWADEAPVEGLLWEHLYTKRQSSQMHDPERISFGRFGNDVYYSNSQYRSGWVVRGHTIGNPLLFADGENPGVDNNIVVAHHVGLKGTLAGADYRLFGTWSRNYGSRRVCLQQECRGSGGATSQIYEPPLTQWSFLLEAERTVVPRYGLDLQAAVSLDTGEVYEERVGVQLGLTWQGTVAP